MKPCFSHARRAALALALVAVFPPAAVFSQTVDSTSLRTVIVSATRSPARADELVSDVVVIERAEIEKSVGRSLPEILARVPGVQFSANGGLGKLSAINIRGTESRHAILLIDGVRYGSATTGAPAWDNIPVEMIERIEILKGPASALYGSDAVGGVVQIFLRKAAAGAGGFNPYASATLGSEKFRQASAGFSGGAGNFSYLLGLQKTREAGFSATNARAPFGNFNPDRDGFDQDSLNAFVAYQINPAWKLDAGLLYADSLSQTDDGPGRDTRYKGRTSVARTGIEGLALPGWKTQLRYSQSVDASRAVEAAPFLFPGLFKTTQNQLTWQNDIATPLGVVLAGAEQLTQKVDSTTAYTVMSRRITSYFVGLNGSAGRHSWQVNARHDENSQFGGSSTGFAGYGFALTPAWRVNVSHGTSFVAPSFNQLYFPGFSNPLLEPERGRNTDIGLSWSDAGQSVKLVHFDNRIRGFITSTTLPANVPRARIDGWTLAYGGAVGAIALRASFDLLDPRNEVTGKRLPRRSASQATLGADHTAGRWTYGGAIVHVGSRYDDAANLSPLGGYTIADLNAGYTLSGNWRLQARLNNLTNRRYETILGYNQPGRGIFVTLRYQPT